MNLLDLTSASLKKISVHFVGNKNTGQPFISTRKPLMLPEEDRIKIKNGFLARFNAELEQYSFHHPTSLDFNEVYKYCLQNFVEDDVFHNNSVNIARHLYESAQHPKIKDGELYVCHFTNCLVDNAFVDAIGLYKTETRTDFIDVNFGDQEATFALRQGVDLSRFDKGCIVFPTNGETGFDVLIIDSGSTKGEEAVFWRENFLSVQPRSTKFFQTNQFLTLTKQFIANQLPEEYDIAKTDQIDLLNKSVEYFRAHDSFDKKKFEKEVFDDAGMIKSFRKFEDNYCDMNNLDPLDSFDISTQAVKKQSRVFKSVLKLDKNFHVYIHGDKSLIEKGFDHTVGKSFYKIYFDEET